MGVGEVVTKVSDLGFQIKVLAETGIIGPMRPDKTARVVSSLIRGGTTPGTAIKVASIKHPDETFIVDEAGSLTFSEVHARTTSLARALARLGVGEEDGVGILCRNHRGFIETMLAGGKLGATSLFLNTMFSGPQLAEVIGREGPKVLVYDEEFEDLLADVPDDVTRVIAWGGADTGDESLEGLIKSADSQELPVPEAESRFIVLTSGTTGTPKGAQRTSPKGLSGIAGLLSKIPHRTDEKMVIAAPLFHSWGFINSIFALTLGATVVLDRRFDPENAMRRVDEHDAEVLVVVPVMLQMILELPEETLDSFHASNLGIVTLSGSALPGGLATEWMDRFGENIYNLYGSTEVAFASIATPADLRIDPATAGRQPHGTRIRLVDENGVDVAAGEVGRIFVNNGMTFEGYTGGGGKEALDDYISSGDVGHIDERGLLFIDGRDDEMIVSGGENVFPGEVEELLANHEHVVEAAVVGVDDEKFGQVLKAFVVIRQSETVTEVDLKSYVKSNLASFKAPKEVVFMDELPRNATGKILKRAL
jgi:acyl-CoA synthetase (AMP-forming)/AMP-acid ligase II